MAKVARTSTREPRQELPGVSNDTAPDGYGSENEPPRRVEHKDIAEWDTDFTDHHGFFSWVAFGLRKGFQLRIGVTGCLQALVLDFGTD